VRWPVRPLNIGVRGQDSLAHCSETMRRGSASQILSGRGGALQLTCAAAFPCHSADVHRLRCDGPVREVCWWLGRAEARAGSCRSIRQRGSPCVQRSSPRGRLSGLWRRRSRRACATRSASGVHRTLLPAHLDAVPPIGIGPNRAERSADDPRRVAFGSSSRTREARKTDVRELGGVGRSHGSGFRIRSRALRNARAGDDPI
jgi:hypothetical protein